MLSNNIRYLRKKNGFTQEDIAKKLGYKSFTTIQRWEKGQTEPNLDTINSLSKIFRVKMNDLVNHDFSQGEPKNTIHTYFSTSDYTEDQLERIREFAEFIKKEDKRK